MVNQKKLMSEGSERAKKDSRINEFFDLACIDMENSTLNFELIKQNKYMKFWKGFIISEYVEELNTFKFIYYGTQLVDNSGLDVTGLTLSDNLLTNAYEDALAMDLDIIQNKSIIFAAGDFENLGKKHINWLSVSLPLLKPSGVVQCLTHTVIT